VSSGIAPPPDSLHRLTTVEALLRRDRAVVAGGIALLTLLAWSYVWMGAGTGMSAMDMTRLALFPHLHAEPMSMASMESPYFPWTLAVLMWWVMMMAMMLPSAAPLVLLYGGVLRRTHADTRPGAVYAPSAFLAGGYLVVWLAFSICAATLQSLLEPIGLLDTSTWWSSSATLSAVTLAAAGIYQLSALKHSCLVQCRGPVGFLMRHWRPGRIGAFVMGARHGALCVGCCWMLMALLFVGGIMNLAWIALLALLVTVEKIAPAGPLVGRISGVVLLLWAVATVVV
jgi:predicted metal-binding membrane protein